MPAAESAARTPAPLAPLHVHHDSPRRPAAVVTSLASAERRARRLLALHEVALAIGGKPDLHSTLELILTQARQLLRSPAGSVYLFDEEEQVLRCTLAHNSPSTMLGGTVQLGEGSVGTAFRDRRTVAINDYRTWSGASPLGRNVGVEAAISVPLRMGPRLLGTLTVHTYEPGQKFDAEDAWLLELLGDQAATALEQARLVEEAEQRAARLLALHKVSTAISAQADIDQTLTLILSQVTELLKNVGSSIFLWNEGEEQLQMAQAVGLPIDQMDRVVKAGDGLTGQVWLSGQPVIVEDYAMWEHATPLSKQAGLKSSAGLPLSVGGRMIGVLVVVDDVKRNRFKPEDIQFLELFAGQAAVAIENARLFEAAARARAMEELNRLKSEFVSTVSHELRTPLTYIQGYSELLLRRRLEPKMEQEAIGELYGASVRMGRLVDDLLDLSRMELGRLRLHRTTVDLGELLRSAVAAARFQYKDHRLKLSARALPPICADPDRLRQVIDNLLTNAHRYAPEGAILLRARANRSGVKIEVVDQGPGIGPEDRHRVFEPFFRGANSAVSPLRGGGLGLSIVRKLVEAHGGSVGVETALGRGSTFWFTLPLREPPLAELEAPGGA